MIFFKVIIYNAKTIIYTDNKNVTYDKDLNSSRWQRWKMVLEEFDYEMCHLPGNSNIGADFYSRNCIIKQENENKSNLILAKIVEILENCQTNKEISENNLKKGTIMCNSLIKTYYKDKDNKLYVFQKGMLSVIQFLHDHFVHPGTSKLYYTIKEEISGKNLKQNIETIVLNCIKCQHSKHFRSNYGQLRNFIIAKKAYEKVSSDILGPIIDKHYTNEKKRYIISFTDIFSRKTCLFIIKDIKAQSIVKKFKLFVNKEPKPEILITDQGRQYMSNIFREFCKRNNIDHRYTCAFTPTANSISERINGVINTVLRIYKGEISMKEAILKAEFYINNTYSRTTASTPNMILQENNLLGIKPIKPMNHSQLYNFMLKKKEVDLERANKSRNTKIDFAIGDLVFCKTNTNKKIAKLWSGPYKIISLQANGNLILLDKGEYNQWHNIRQVRLKRGENVVTD